MDVIEPGAVVNAAREMFSPQSAVLTLTYFGGERIVPGYNVMGICKAALDACMKYAAFDLGPRGAHADLVATPSTITEWNPRRSKTSLRIGLSSAVSSAYLKTL